MGNATIIVSTLLSVALYFAVARMSRYSGVGSMGVVSRWGRPVAGSMCEGCGRSVAGAGFARENGGLARWWGDGARAGLKGRGMVVARDVSGSGGGDGGVGVDAGVAATVGGAEGGMMGMSAGCGGFSAGIEVLDGVAGVGCDEIGFEGDGLGCDEGVGFSTAGLLVLVVFPVAVEAFFNVPVFFTCSNILLVADVAGVGCSGDVTVFGASFFTAVFFAGAFFSFLASTSFCFGAAFVEVFPTVVFFTSATGTSPTSSATTFFGRPRFFTTGGSTLGVAVGIIATQLG